MRAAIVLLLLPALLLGAGSAAAAQPDAHAQAEYLRLSQQMRDYAARNAWSGVDRSFRRMLDADLPVDAEDYKLAAEAARLEGNAQAWQDRLIKAMEDMPDIKAARSLAEIQGNYGRVILVAKDTTSALTPVVAPFQPDRIKAIAFAGSQLSERGRFDGLLPAGTYTFGDKQFEVEPGHEPVEIALHKLAE